MDFKNLIFSFFVGGGVIALIVGLEKSQMRTISGIAMLLLVTTTLVSYFLLVNRKIRLPSASTQSLY